MTDWLIIGILVALVVFIVALLVLRRNGWSPSEITVWPPNVKLVPPKVKTADATIKDTLLVEAESEIGNYTNEKAAPTTDVKVTGKSKARDITVKR